ncbi:hypothetical protein EK21DRAFT_72945, partial [Setomelanomma holmii]
LREARMQASLERARLWLYKCRIDHVACRKEIPHLTRYPTRLLEIESQTSVRLIETRGIKSDYACLSHCWGPEGNSKVLGTLKDNYETFKENIPWSMMPATFRDVVWFTFRLGITHIWIDSLCIVQDDLADWDREGAIMADIYTGCVVTLAATVSLGADQGCLPERFTSSKTRFYGNILTLASVSVAHCQSRQHM